MFIDNLSDDKSTLSSCSLVCSAWTRSSQRWLFNSLAVLPRGPGPGRFTHFQRWLQRKPHICTYIRHLQLSSTRNPKDFCSPVNRPPINAAETLLDIVRMLHHLTSLRLQQVRFPGQRRPYALLDRRTARLEALDIDCAGDDLSTIHDLLAIIGLFDEIKVLRMHGIKLDVFQMFPEELERELARVSLPPQTQIHGLDLGLVAPLSSFMCDLFSKSNNLNTLTSLETICEDFEDVIALGHFLRVSGETLQHLRLDPLGSIFDIRENNPSIPGDVWTELHLGACRSLQSLGFVMEIGIDASEVVPDDQAISRMQWKAFLDILRNVPPRSLRSVQLELSLWQHADEWLGNQLIIDWAGFDDLLSKFPKLETVAFHLLHCTDGPLRDDEFRTYCSTIEGMLPSIREKRLLRVTRK